MIEPLFIPITKDLRHFITQAYEESSKKDYMQLHKGSLVVRNYKAETFCYQLVNEEEEFSLNFPLKDLYDGLKIKSAGSIKISEEGITVCKSKGNITYDDSIVKEIKNEFTLPQHYQELTCAPYETVFDVDKKVFELMSLTKSFLTNSYVRPAMNYFLLGAEGQLNATDSIVMLNSEHAVAQTGKNRIVPACAHKLFTSAKLSECGQWLRLSNGKTSLYWENLVYPLARELFLKCIKECTESRIFDRESLLNLITTSADQCPNVGLEIHPHGMFITTINKKGSITREYIATDDSPAYSEAFTVAVSAANLRKCLLVYNKDYKYSNRKVMLSFNPSEMTPIVIDFTVFTMPTIL